MPGENRIPVATAVVDTDEATRAIDDLAGKLGELPARALPARDELGRFTSTGRDAAAAAEHLAAALGVAGPAALAAAGAVGATVGALNHFQAALGVAHEVGRYGAELYNAAAAAEIHQRALAQLGPAYELVRRSTNDTVSAELAWRTQQELLGARLHLTGEELATVSQAARAYAREHLVDVDTAMQRVTRALESGGRGLREFGVHLERGAYGARQAHDAVRQMADRMREAGVPARDLGENAEVTGRQLREAFGDAALAAVNGLGRAFADLVTRISGVDVSMRSVTAALRGLADESQDRANLARSNDELERRRQILEAIGRHESRLAAMGIHGHAPSPQELARYTTGELGQLSLALAGAGTADVAQAAFDQLTHAGDHREAAQQQAAQQQAAAVATDERGFGRPGSSGAGREARLEALQREYEQLVAAARRGGAQLAEVQRATNESTAHYLERELAAQRAFNERHRELEDKRLTDEREAADRREQWRRADQQREAQLLELAQRHREEVKRHNREVDDDLNAQGVAQRQAADAGLQLRNVFVQNAQVQGTAAQQLAGTVNSAFGSMTNSVKSHVAALIAGRESVGQALQGMLADTLSSIAQEATVKALLYGAKAIADAVTPGMQGFVAGDLAGAAAFAATAAAAGIGAFAVGSIGGGAQPAAAGGGALPPPTASSGGGAGAGPGTAGGGTTINVNVNGTLFTNEGVTVGVVRALNDARMRGLVPYGG